MTKGRNIVVFWEKPVLTGGLISVKLLLILLKNGIY